MAAAAVKCYLDQAVPLVQAYARAMAWFAAQVRAAASEPAVCHTAAWKGPTSAALRQLRDAANQLHRLQPVPTILPEMGMWEDLAEETAALAGDVARWIDDDWTAYRTVLRRLNCLHELQRTATSAWARVLAAEQRA